MRYVSTRGQAPQLDFAAATLAGLAIDGGLYVPEQWPRLAPDEIAALAGLSYAEVATRVMAPFVAGSLDEARLHALSEKTYAAFHHRAVAPLVQCDARHWLLELFHGPTLAFKDIALQFLGNLFDLLLQETGRRLTIIGATSGDTGSAAIHAVAGRENVDIFMLHPAGRVSEVQRRQMTTVLAPNVHNIAIGGTFDDCQAMVKTLFGDADLRASLMLSAVNSINWARIMAQVVYYFASAVALGAPRRAIAFAVPTGNFGDVFAGYVAAQMGLPISRLIVATNVNDIVCRALRQGEYAAGEVTPTISPSMDIQVSSNFERLLFDLCRRDGAAVAALMAEFARARRLRLTGEQLRQARQIFTAQRVDEDTTARAIAEVHEHCGLIIDPHSAVGYAAARAAAAEGNEPIVTLATAHPGKFRDAVERACGIRPSLPRHVGDLFGREERYQRLANDWRCVRAHILEHARP
ncbi:MAG: threonine synthase [Pseudomonadota bacterium]